MTEKEKTPLTWGTITVASRIMLPTYILMFTIVGLNFLLTNESRLLQSPGLSYANSIMNIKAWGLMFLFTVVLMVVSFFSKSRTLFQYALNISALCMFIWTIVLAASAIEGASSPSGWSWPAFIMAACIASTRSLSAEEK